MCQANAIGRSSKTVREFLEKNHKDNLTREESIKLAVKSLLEVVQTGAKNIEISVMESYGKITVRCFKLFSLNQARLFLELRTFRNRGNCIRDRTREGSRCVFHLYFVDSFLEPGIYLQRRNENARGLLRRRLDRLLWLHGQQKVLHSCMECCTFDVVFVWSFETKHFAIEISVDVFCNSYAKWLQQNPKRHAGRSLTNMYYILKSSLLLLRCGKTRVGPLRPISWVPRIRHWAATLAFEFPRLPMRHRHLDVAIEKRNLWVGFRSWRRLPEILKASQHLRIDF